MRESIYKNDYKHIYKIEIMHVTHLTDPPACGKYALHAQYLLFQRVSALDVFQLKN